MISSAPISAESNAATPGGFTPAIVTLKITESIDVLTLPINCVVAGQQKEPVKKAMGLTGAISGPLRGIFDE